jgi:hypothetical protein
MRRWALPHGSLLTVAAAVGLAVIAATPAGAQPATEIIARSSWTPGASPGLGVAGDVGATFEAAAPSGGNYTVGLFISGPDFVGTLTGVSDSGLGGSCTVGGDGRSIACTWAAPQRGETASITATVNVSALPPTGTRWLAVPTIDPSTNVQIFTTGSTLWGELTQTPLPGAPTTTTEAATTPPDATISAPEATPNSTEATSISTVATITAPAASGMTGTGGGGGGGAVTPTGKPPAGALPATGGITRPLVPIAALLVIAGATVIAATSRRPRERR